MSKERYLFDKAKYICVIEFFNLQIDRHLPPQIFCPRAFYIVPENCDDHRREDENLRNNTCPRSFNNVINEPERMRKKAD